MNSILKRPGSITFMLAGLVLLLIVAGVLATTVPLADCPAPRHQSIALFADDCPRCGDRQTITLINKWLWRPTREEYDRMQKPTFP